VFYDGARRKEKTISSLPNVGEPVLAWKISAPGAETSTLANV
jgi:hypothetical protein